MADLPIPEDAIERAAKGMLASNAWPVVFRANVATYLARIALTAALGDKYVIAKRSTLMQRADQKGE